MSTANMSTANMSTANMSTANMSTANMSTANMSTANMSTCTLDHDTAHSSAFKCCAICYVTEATESWCVNKISYDKLSKIKEVYNLRLIEAMVRGCRCDVCGRETVNEETMFVIIGDAI